MKFSISDTLDTAWQFAKKYGWKFALIIFVISMISNSLSYPPGFWEAALSGNSQALSEIMANRSSLSSLPSLLISMVIGVALSNAYLRTVTGKEKGFTWDCFNLPFSTYAKVTVFSIVLGLIISVGLIFLVVPGLYLGARLWMGQYYLLQHPEAGIGDAFNFAWKATSDSAWTQVGFLLVLILVGLSGVLACCVGIYFTSTIASFATAVAYLHYTEHNRSFSPQV